MDANDTIIKRLRTANDVELRTLAQILKVNLKNIREIDISMLSAEYRSSAGNTFANWFRDKHELQYRSILEECVSQAAEGAMWKKCRVLESYKDEWLEEYLIRALIIIARGKNEKIPAGELKLAREEAEEILVGAKSADSKLEYDETGLVEIIAEMYLVLTGAYFLYLPFNALTNPSPKKIWPATMVFIHIRKRIEAEQKLRNIKRVS